MDKHVTRMPEERLPKKILYGELEMGKRSHSGQKKRYKDTLKASLKDFNIQTELWEQIAQDRAKWRGLIRRGPVFETFQKQRALLLKEYHIWPNYCYSYPYNTSGQKLKYMLLFPLFFF